MCCGDCIYCAESCPDCPSFPLLRDTEIYRLEAISHVENNTTSCYVNHVYTLLLKLSSVIKKFRLSSIFCIFRIRSKHFERCFDNSEPLDTSACQNCQVDPLRLAAQSTVYRSLHTEFTEIGGLLFNMWL